jgi:hypothetical protein
MNGPITGYATSVLFFGALAFPIFGLIIGAIGGKRGLFLLLVVWSLVGLALTFPARVGGVPAAVWVFVLPPVAYIATALWNESPSKSPALGRATLVLVVTYPICLGLLLGILL